MRRYPDPRRRRNGADEHDAGHDRRHPRDDWPVDVVPVAEDRRPGLANGHGGGDEAEPHQGGEPEQEKHRLRVGEPSECHVDPASGQERKPGDQSGVQGDEQAPAGFLGRVDVLSGHRRVADLFDSRMTGP